MSKRFQSAADLRRDAERRRREMLDQLRAGRPTGHDGWCEPLEIYLPKPTVLERGTNQINI